MEKYMIGQIIVTVDDKYKINMFSTKINLCE